MAGGERVSSLGRCGRSMGRCGRKYGEVWTICGTEGSNECGGAVAGRERSSRGRCGEV